MPSNNAHVVVVLRNHETGEQARYEKRGEDSVELMAFDGGRRWDIQYITISEAQQSIKKLLCTGFERIS